MDLPTSLMCLSTVIIMSHKTLQKVALVTGANGGIGNALTLEFNRRGYKVYATDIIFTPQVEAEFKSKNITCLLMDVTSEEAVSKVSTQVAFENDRELDFLYCNAGRTEIGFTVDLTDEQIRSLYEINLFGNMRLVRHFVRPLINAKGTIAFSGSVTKDLPLIGNCLYASSKAALDEFSFVLHSELRNYGVKVIDVIGGYINTPIFNSGITEIKQGSVYDFPEFKALQNKRREKLKAVARTAMPPEVFACRVLNKIEKSDISTFRIYEGTKSGTIDFCSRWLSSKKLVDYFLGMFEINFDYRKRLNGDKF